MNQKVKHLAAANLKKLMDLHQINDKDLSDSTGVPTANISRLKNNLTCNPTLGTLLPIAKYFGVTVSELIGDVTPSSKQLVDSCQDTKASLRQIQIDINDCFERLIQTK